MHVDLGVVTPKRSLGLQWEIKKFLDQLLTPTARGGGTLGISGWGCAAGTLNLYQS